MKKDFPTIFFLLLISLFTSSSFSADAPTTGTSVSAANNSSGKPINIGAVPTPDTIPAPDLGSTGSSIPVPLTQQKSYGRFQNEKDGTVKIAAMFLERYKESVVRVRVLDQAGNEIGKAMGVSVGKNPQYIATPLSLILGNTLQWADQIEISHAQGNKYFAKIAIIDEQLDLVLLAPENYPAPIPFTRPLDERAQISVFTISFEDKEDEIKPDIHRAYVAAINSEMGTLSISGKTLTNAQSGTGIINMNGELVGMMLPGGHGVLASTLSKRAEMAKKSTPLDPNMLGVVMGRGVLVDKKNPEAYQSISSAIQAMNEGKAPKTDPKRYIPAKTRTFSPKEAERVILKVMPGTYKEEKTLILPSEISFTGSGTNETIIIGTNPKAPVISLKKSNNVAITNFRIVPAPLQSADAATIEIIGGKLIRIIGNLIEAKGGSALAIDQTVNSAIFANVFPTGKLKGISCKNSALLAEGNAFYGDWDQAISVDKACALNIVQNLFLQNKTAISISGLSSPGSIINNSFIKAVAGVRFTGVNRGMSVKDNLFFENAFNLYSTQDLSKNLIDKNAIWKGKIVARGSSEKAIIESKLVSAKPVFQDPEKYDFRIKPGTPQLIIGGADESESLYYGAFQYKNKEMMGRFSSNLAHVLEVATGQNGLAEAWGY